MAPEMVRLSPKGQAVLLGVLATAVVLASVALTIHYNRGGQWSALYCHGTPQSLPPAIEAEHPYRFEGFGFDGQYYHIIAHDPFFRRGFERYVDDPRLRYRRGLLPVAAHLLALGSDRWVHVTYPALVFVWGALGVYWLALLAVAAGRSSLWGLAFMVLPGVIASFDRMTPDIGLIALMAAFLLALRARNERLLWLSLTLAPLVRETGLLLVIGTVMARMLRDGPARGCRYLLALLPALAWFAFVHAHVGAQPFERSALPLSDIIGVLVEPRPYQSHAPVVALVNQWTDAIAVLGAIWGFLLVLLRRGVRDEAQLTGLLFVVMGIVLQRRDIWDHVFCFGRIYSPVLVLLLRDGLLGYRRMRVAGSPTVLMLPRVATQLGSQVWGVVRGLL